MDFVTLNVHSVDSTFTPNNSLGSLMNYISEDIFRRMFFSDDDELDGDMSRSTVVDKLYHQ